MECRTAARSRATAFSRTTARSMTRWRTACRPACRTACRPATRWCAGSGGSGRPCASTGAAATTRKLRTANRRTMLPMVTSKVLRARWIALVRLLSASRYLTTEGWAALSAPSCNSMLMDAFHRPKVCNPLCRIDLTAFPGAQGAHKCNGGIELGLIPEYFTPHGLLHRNAGQ